VCGTTDQHTSDGSSQSGDNNKSMKDEFRMNTYGSKHDCEEIDQETGDCCHPDDPLMNDFEGR
jgi:hypothetical protein